MPPDQKQKALLPYLSLRAYTALREFLYRNGRECNIAMLHTARCGSTVITNTLKQVPGFHWADEIFEFMDRKYGRIMGFRDVVPACIRHQMYRKKARYFGFDTKYLACQHLREDWVGMSISEYTDLLTALGFDRFILLYRKNYLRQMVSHEVAVQRQCWHTSNRTEAPSRVELDFLNYRIGSFHGELIDLFETMEASYEAVRVALMGRKCLTLVYEDDILPDPLVAIDRIIPFLGITLEQPVNCRLQRTNPFPLEQIVTNYADLSAYLSGSGYAWMLNQDGSRQ